MIKSLQLVFVFFLIAILIGSIPLKISKDKQGGLLKSVLYGCIIMLVFFEVLVIPLTIAGLTLTKLTFVWTGLIGITSVFSLFFAKGFLIEKTKRLPGVIKNFTYLDGIVLLLLLVQVYVCVKYVFLHENDAYYLGMTSTTLSSDRFLTYSPYTGAKIQWYQYKFHLLAALPAFWAMLAKLFGVTGAYICHTVVPIIFIPIGYILYREIGLLLFKQDKKAVNIFLILICFSNFFIGKHYDLSYEMLSTTIWQGGTFLANIALPGIFYFEFKLLRRNRKKTDFIMLLMMLVLGTMTVPQSGLVLSILTVIVLGLSFTVDKLLTRRKRMDAGINI